MQGSAHNLPRRFVPIRELHRGGGNGSVGKVLAVKAQRLSHAQQPHRELQMWCMPLILALGSRDKLNWVLAGQSG